MITTTQLEAVKNVTASSSLFLLKAAGIIFILAIVGINLKNILSKSPEENLKLPKVLSTTNQRTKSPAKINTIKAPPVAEDPSSATPIQVNIIQAKKDVFQKSEIVINDLKLKNISLGEKQFIEDNSVTGEKLDEIFPLNTELILQKESRTSLLMLSRETLGLHIKLMTKRLKNMSYDKEELFF